MSEKHFKLTLVTPEHSLLDGEEAIAVNAQGTEGTFNARPGHEPFLTALKDRSELWYRSPSGEVVDFYVEDGFVEVLPDRVTVLAGYACRNEEMSKDDFLELENQRTAEIRKKIEETKKIQDTEKGRIEIEELEIQLQKSVTRLQYAKKTKVKR
ncbi:MAG: F0F1 ATP synthase subunit epsilon [Deltaproteobacteria bacterium]|jgi:F-type H+-transporting ATPase subunit epsilon|nr:F0F1 ATP synthase subunit epsilon [Deltaproteobacteria bacterium]